MYFKYLKKRATLYLISGLLFCVILSAVLLLYKYENALVKTSRKMNIISINKLKIKNDTDKIEKTLMKLNKILPNPLGKMAAEEHILRSIDGIRFKNSNAVTVVTHFQEIPNGVSLPVEISFPLKNYKDTVRFIEYLEGIRFPYFKVEVISIMREGEKKILCKIKGSMIIPHENS